MKTTKQFVLCAGLVAVLSSSSGQTFLTNGLVGHYPFNGNALDASGNSNSAIVVGAILGTNRFGLASNSYSFAAGTYIRTTNSVGFPISTNDFSASLWLKLSQLVTTDYQMIFCNRTVNQFQFNLRPFVGSVSELQFYTGGGGDIDFQSPSLQWTTNRWYNLQMVRSNNFLTIFRDGALVAQGALTQGNTAASADRVLDFGYRASNYNHPLYGQLDDIRIYNFALSTNELSQLYQFEAAKADIAGVGRALRLDCTNLVVGGVYQIQASADFTTWSKYGAPFTANSTNASAYVDVGWSNSFFRLNRE